MESTTNCGTQLKAEIQDQDYQLYSELHRIFSYDKHTGIFSRRIKRGKYNVGTEIHTGHNQGYKAIYVNGKLYLQHRMAWLYVYNEMPIQIDHINGDRTDNRLVNLRNVTQNENAKNTKLHKRNTSGVTGVYKTKTSWIARICINSKDTLVGTYQTKEEAVRARKQAEIDHDYHKNHGRIKDERNGTVTSTTKRNLD